MSILRPILQELDPDTYRDLQIEQQLLLEQDLEQEELGDEQ